MSRKRYKCKFVLHGEINIIISHFYWLELMVMKYGKTKFTSWGKLMTEFQFYY